MDKWPLIEGRYVVGNTESPVAVCTNSTVAGIELDMDKVSIVGKCVTENIGIEKIIQNTVSNPKIRYMILCGKVSKGHFVSQAIESLIKNGVDKEKRIIGAKGNTPFLKNIDNELIERFRKQITPVNIMGETNNMKIMIKVEECLSKGEGSFQGKPVKIEQVQEIEAKSCPKWIPDPKGFFVITINDRIIVEHYMDNKLKNKIKGDTANDIGDTIAYLSLIGEFEQTLEHAMYLGRELQKAEYCLINNIEYVQDKELKVKQEPDEYGWHD